MTYYVLAILRQHRQQQVRRTRNTSKDQWKRREFNLQHTRVHSI